MTMMLASYYVVSQKNSKQENFALGTQQQKIWIKIIASRLCYELGLHGKKNFIGNSGILWKMDIVKMTHFTLLVKLKILRQ